MGASNIQTAGTIKNKKMRNNIAVESVVGYDGLPVTLLTKMARWILKSEAQPHSWTITFIFVDNHFITELNERYLARSTPTDVISFNLSDSERAPEGEIYISFDMARAQAACYHVSIENELLRLAAHGVYHLLGYDDSTTEERQIMTHFENKALEYVYSTF